MRDAHGWFVVIEGGEGAGKSTVLRALADRLAAAGRAVVTTREPGGTALGERIRELLLHDGADTDPLAELLLFEAARAQLVATMIRPALNEGAVVLCDRFGASSVAYQGYGRALGREIVERANAVATGGLAPDLTLLLDLPAAAGLARRANEGAQNDFDREDLAFHERVRAGFIEQAASSPTTWCVIDAKQTLTSVIDDAWEHVARLLDRS